MKQFKKIIAVLVLGAALLQGAQTIEITPKQQKDLGIKTQKVIKVEEIALPPYNGTVLLEKKDIISINSNIESIVQKIYVSDFEHVKKGQKLLTLRSNALLNIQSAYIESNLQSLSAQQNYQRDLKLEKEGIISKKRLLTSQRVHESAELTLKLNANQLLTNGFSQTMLEKIKKNNKPIVEQDVFAPRDGVIYKVAVNAGEFVHSDKMMIGIYADAKRYIELAVPVEVVESISLGDICSFSKYTAEVVAIGNVVNVASQSVQIRAEIKDASSIMINRVYGVKVHKKVEGAVKIKKSALVFVEGEPFVFKKVSKGFEVTSVEIVSEGAVCYIVKSQLDAGDLLAVSSTAALLSAMESEDE